MQENNLQLEIYNNYKNGLGYLKEYIKILDNQIRKGWADFMELVNDLSHLKESLKVVPEKYKDEGLEEIDRLTKENTDLDNYINALKEQHRPYVDILENPPQIPVPPDNGYEIRNGLLETERDILLKETRNPGLTNADLQQIMGTSKPTASYRNHYLFQDRNLPRPYNEFPSSSNVTDPKP
jgi:hypothetical protein